MAKGNMLQGMARGKVGDVVFYRMDGEQMSRVRNRHPQNPRTNAQLYQRAIMATIIQAYSAGREIFDHAFEGKKVGNDNMREFLSRNMKVLRENVAADLYDNVALSEQTGHVVAPKSTEPVPVIGLVASRGSLKQTLFNVVAATNATGVTITTPAAANGSQNIAEYFSEAGIQAGEIFTFVAFTIDDNRKLFQLQNVSGNYATQYGCTFRFARLIVKNELSTTKTITNATFGDIFDIEQSGFAEEADLASQKFDGQTIEIADLMGAEYMGTFGIIRSNENEKLRSTTFMVPMTNSHDYGIASFYALEAWKQETTLIGDSELILEGGDIQVSIPNTSNTDGSESGGGGNPPMGGD